MTVWCIVVQSVNCFGFFGCSFFFSWAKVSTYFSDKVWDVADVLSTMCWLSLTAHWCVFTACQGELSPTSNWDLKCTILVSAKEATGNPKWQNKSLIEILASQIRSLVTLLLNMAECRMIHYFITFGIYSICFVWRPCLGSWTLVCKTPLLCFAAITVFSFEIFCGMCPSFHVLSLSPRSFPSSLIHTWTPKNLRQTVESSRFLFNHAHMYCTQSNGSSIHDMQCVALCTRQCSCVSTGRCQCSLPNDFDGQV